MQKILSKLTIFLLRSKRLSGDERTAVMNALLDNLHAVKIEDVVSFDEQGIIKLHGKKLEMEQAISFMESCRVLEDNFARKIIRDQINYEATKIGVHNGLNAETIQFSKAALWQGQQEERILQSLIQK